MAEHPFINRDLSWLSFNERVLQEAEDKTVPLIERIRFLGIYSNNRDEFFRVRVATARRMLKWPKKGKSIFGESPAVLLDNIVKTVKQQQKRFEHIYDLLLKDLEKEGIFLVDEKQITDQEGVLIRRYFLEKVQPLLMPVMIDTAPRFPYLRDKMVYLAVKIIQDAHQKKYKYAVIELPTEEISRFILLPPHTSRQKIMMLDDVVRYCLDDIFYMVPHQSISAHTIKMTRDAELDISGDLSKSILEKISKSVKLRKVGQPVRLTYDEKIPADFLKLIVKKTKLREKDDLIPGGRYHNFKDFMNFPDLGKKHLRYPKHQPLSHPVLSNAKGMLKAIRKQDILLSYPYHSFHHTIDLLREASIDPKVESIRITVYRLATQSSIVNALINAIKNGKQVTVVMELQARFDEETNIYFANKLQEEGAEVVYGVPGLKVHGKLILITRREEDQVIQVAYIGTGNFNEKTSLIYTDHALITADKRICNEVGKVFAFFRNNFKIGEYKHLLVSPFNMRKRLLGLIQQEIKNASSGKPAYMVLKMNSLVDGEMIEKLYRASQAGVKIKLIIRGICSLVTELKGFSDNIEVISVVDKFLEHSRIFVFGNGGDELFYISSADWMFRNLDSRSEVSVPIFDSGLKEQLRTYLSIQLADNTKARIINRKQDNSLRKSHGNRSRRCQEDIGRWFSGKADFQRLPAFGEGFLISGGKGN